MRWIRVGRGQTLVELAMILPVLLMIIMGIIEFSYITYGWGQVQFAARRGAEQASKAPPSKLTYGKPPTGDRCYTAIIDEMQKIGALVPIDQSEVTLRVLVDNGSASINPNDRFSTDPDKPAPAYTWEKKDIGKVIEVIVDRKLAPLTPLGRTLFGPEVRFTSASRRTIVGIESPGMPNCGPKT